MAARAYGVAFAALRGSIYILQFISMILFLGSAWAKVTLLEYPNSQDKDELDVIQKHQLIFSILAQGFFIIYYFNYGSEINVTAGAIILGGGWIFVFRYEWRLERKEKGILAGPGVPFLRRELTDKIKRKYSKKKGGGNEKN